MQYFKSSIPNVFFIKSTEPLERGQVVDVQTASGNFHECQIYNLMAKDKNGAYYYSYERLDGNYAAQKAEKLYQAADNAGARGDAYVEAANEGKDFLSLGEPIKVGHHSEKKHRALIERNYERMRRANEEYKKIDTLEARAAYWERKAAEINLSKPESVEYYKHKLEEAKAKHAAIKATPKHEREHSYSLTYANNAVKDFAQKVELAEKLWGEPTEITK
jgi:hypothetical protein